MSTTFATSAFEHLSCVTPNIQIEEWDFIDADEEMVEIAQFIKEHTPHNMNIEPERIKFFYMNKPKKIGGKFVIGDIAVRPRVERLIENKLDFIVFIHYAVWKELDNENKVMQLDKVLCGADVNTMDADDVKKKATDSREYVENMKHFGSDKILNSSEIVHLTVERMLEEEKEAKKIAKEAAKANG